MCGECQCCVADKPVTALGNSFDVARMFRGIAKQVTDLLNRRVQTVVEVHERIGGPKGLLQFFAGDNFAAAFEQDA